MDETPEDLATLQQLLDRSDRLAGPHLREVITADRRLTAEVLVGRLSGMCLLALATVTSDHRPLVGPVDGFFHRGSFHFGSSTDSVRFSHIRRGSHVSATFLPGEELAVTVHGRAAPIDVGSGEQAGFRRTLLDYYVPRFGPSWEDFLDSGEGVYARIDADRMFTFHLNPNTS